MNYIVNPDVVELERKYHIEARKVFEDCLIESKVNDSNINTNINTNINNITYKNIIVNNSNNNIQGQGMLKFIESVTNYIGFTVKIYLYKLETIDYVIGPIFIESREKIFYILHHIIHNIRRECYTTYNDVFLKRVNEYFTLNKELDKLAEEDMYY
jgi:hypothetical protein